MFVIAQALEFGVRIIEFGKILCSFSQNLDKFHVDKSLTVVSISLLRTQSYSPDSNVKTSSKPVEFEIYSLLRTQIF